MKVRIKDKGSDQSWIEDWKNGRLEGESDETWARRVVDEYNQSLRPHEKEREFVDLVPDEKMTQDQIIEANNLIDELEMDSDDFLTFAQDEALDGSFTEAQVGEEWKTREEMYASLTEYQGNLLLEALRERVIDNEYEEEDDEEFDDEDEEEE